MTWYPYVEADVRPGWWDRAACRGMDPAMFFPERGDAVDAAKAICAQCPVRIECLDYALDHKIRHGVWGGMSERQREKVRRGIRTQSVIYDMLEYPSTVTQLAERSGRTPDSVQSSLRQLTRRGRVECDNGTWWRT